MFARCVVVLSLVLTSAAQVAAQDWKATADALGIKRVLVPAGTKIGDLVDAEGSLVELPFADFKTRLEAIEQIRNAVKLQPRLVKATYRANFVGEHLTGGTGRWTIEHPGSSASVFPIKPLNLALQKPRFEGERAILGDINGANLGLWVEKPGLHTVGFDWSLRGVPGVQGVAFDLRLPPCPLTAIELTLPADQSLATPKGTTLVTGPHDADKIGYKVWKLHVAGRTQVDFLVRRGNEVGNAPRVFSSNETRVQLSPEHTLYDFEANAEVLHAPIAEQSFEIDPSLQPYEVTSRRPIDKWQIEPPRPGKSTPVLRVHFREPVIGLLGGLRIRATGPRWTNQESATPRIEMLDAIGRGETLKLQLHPDQHLERWDPAAYRLVQAATEKDGGQTLTLIDSEPEGKGARPRFLVRTQGVDFTVHQDTRWRIDPSGMTLSSELQYDLSRGQLFALEVRLPKNAAWRVTSVDLAPRDALQKWDIAGGVLRVDLQRGITPRTDVKLSVQLHDARDRTAMESRTIDFPDLEPIGANLRQGTLALLADTHQRVVLLQSNLPTVRPDAALAKDPKLRFFFAFRQTPVTGKIRLFPQQPVLQAKTNQIVTFTPDMVKVKADLAIEPVVGQAAALNVFLAGAGNDPWRFEAKGAEIAKKERLPLPEIAALGLGLTANHGPILAAARLLQPVGQVWRIHFREPIAKGVTLTASQDLIAPRPQTLASPPPPLLALDYGIPLAALTRPKSDRTWRIPIVIPLDVERIDGELLLQPLGASLTSVRSHGLEAAARPGSVGGTFARLYRFTHASLLEAPALRVKVEQSASGNPAQAILEAAELTTYVDPTGGVLHSLRLTVWNWRAKEFRVVLPPGAALVAGRFNPIDLDRIPQTAIDGGVEIFMPMSQDAGVQSIELVYRTESSPWFGSMGKLIPTPLPSLPQAPLIVRREVRLAAGWLPLRQENMFSFDRRAPARDALLGVWRTGQELADDIFPGTPPSWVDPQRLSFLSAEGTVRRSGVRDMAFGEALAKILFFSKKSVPLVLDRDALRSLGLTSKSGVSLVADSSTPFWESLGLVYVPTPHAALLTTRDRAGEWNPSIRAGDPRGTLLTRAIDSAFEHGEDSSGRFCAADVWLRTEPPAKTATPWFAETLHGDETIWQTIASTHDDAIVIVRQSQIRGFALFLAFVSGGFGLIVRRVVSARAFFCYAGAMLLVGLLGLAIAPAAVCELVLGPLAATVILLVVAYQQMLRRDPQAPGPMRSGRSTQKALKASFGAIALVSAMAFGLCQAQAPEAKVAFLLSQADGSTSSVLMRTELLRWLDEQQKEPRLIPEAPVFLGSRYQGRWEENAVVVKAEFEVYAFNDGAALTIPLVGVNLLEGSSLDGRETFPVVAPGGKPGYQIRLPQQGFHTLALSFLVRREPTGEVAFGVPAVACASLRITAPEKVGKLRLARSWGEEMLRHDAKTGEQILEAQLGGETSIKIEGFTPAKAVAAGLQVKELYLWDLRLGNYAAHGLLSYDAAGEVGQVEIKLPTTLEVYSVELLEHVGRGAGIRSWRIVPRDGGRMLQVDFSQPLTGSFQILLGMTPRWPKSSGSIELRLPFPLRANITDGMVGFRADEPDALEKTQFLGVAAVSADMFVKEWFRLSQRESAVPLHAFSFARASKNAAAAALEVTPLPSRPRVQSVVTWTTQPQTIGLDANLTISAIDEFSLVPIKLAENVVLRDIQGADVHHWSRNGSALDIWLVGPRKKTALTIVGWIPHTYPKSKTIALPSVTVVGAAAETSLLTLAAATGFALEPTLAKGFAEEPADASGRHFRLGSGASPVECRMRSHAAVAEFETLTTAEVHDDACAVGLHLHGRIDYGEFPDLQVRVVDWPTSAPRLIVPFAGAKVKHAVSGRDHVWTISVPPGTPQQISLSVLGKMPLAAGVAFNLPQVVIERGGRLSETIVALAGAQIAASQNAGATNVKLASVRSSTKELLPWPLEQARLRAAGAQFGRLLNGSHALAVQSRAVAIAPVAQILSAQHRIVVGDEQQWLHQMAWTLWATSGIDLDVHLPPGSKFAASRVDDQPASPRQAGPDLISLPISASMKPRTVVVSWTYPADKESIPRPQLAPATLAGLKPIAVHGELLVPAGWNALKPSWAVPKTEVLLNDLRREGRVVQILGEDLSTSPKSIQTALVQSMQSFAATVRQISYRSSLLEPTEARNNIERLLKAAIDEEQKRRKALGLEAARATAEKSPGLAPQQDRFAGIDSGMPLFWTDVGDAAAPTPTLRRSSEPAPHVLAFALAMALLLLSFWNAAIKAWVQFWPEQLAIVAVLGLLLGGFSFVGVGLLLIAAAGRLFNLTDRARRLLRRARA